jgi:hypothetical protein
MPNERPGGPGLVTNGAASYENVTIETFDQAIKDWFDLTVDAKVTQPANGGLYKVPVVLAAGERWATGRTRKGLRDSNGILILPVIYLRRTSIAPDPSMKALGIETPTITIAKKISQKTGRLQQDSAARLNPLKLSSKAAVYEVTTIPFPDRGIINYELVVQTQYIDQMNHVLQKVFHELDLQKSFVAPFYNDHRHPQLGVPFEDRGKMPIKGGYAVGYFDIDMSNTGNFEEYTDQERIVKWSTSFRVPYVFQLDPEGEKPAVQVERTIYSVAFGVETTGFVDDPADLDKIFGK